MKKLSFVLFVFSVMTFSCREICDLSGLEEEVEMLKEDINKLQSVISLHVAYSSQKKIVSITEKTVNNSGYWVITFSDNTSIPLSKSVVISWTENIITEEYEIILSNDQAFVFNYKEIIHPTGIVILTQEICFMKNTEVTIEFRVNPSNAIFNYDITSDDCQIAFDMASESLTYSYVTEPERCRMTRIEQILDAEGKAKEGQYKAYIRDNGYFSAYKYVTALVLSSFDKNGDAIQLSSSAIPVVRKKDTGLPVVVIHTEHNAEIVDKENWIPADMMIDGIGKFDNYEGKISIRGRGNSTWIYPKKPYAIKLDSKDEILGMPSHERWMLLANYMDRTLLRNHIAFEISRRTGLEWTPRGQFVEVMLNDIHLGNYYLCEQIRIDKNRVDIMEMASSDIEDESITGGYLLEMDTYYDEVNKFKSIVCDLPVMIKEPDEEVLTVEQFDYIRNFIDSTEIILYEPDFAMTRNYTSRIADTTFIDWWFVMELTFNYEAIHPKSSYFYKDRSDVLKAGPVWDFDWGTFMNSSGFCVKETLWFSQLFKDPVFVNKVKERWEKFKPSFEEIDALIQNERDHLTLSAELNDAMWSLKNFTPINEDEDLPYDNALYKMRNNYLFRLEWLDQQIRNF
jgi:hypothetical protein